MKDKALWMTISFFAWALVFVSMDALTGLVSAGYVPWMIKAFMIGLFPALPLVMFYVMIRLLIRSRPSWDGVLGIYLVNLILSLMAVYVISPLTGVSVIPSGRVVHSQSPPPAVIKQVGEPRKSESPSGVAPENENVLIQEEEVRALVTRIHSALNQRDMANFRKTFWEDASVVFRKGGKDLELPIEQFFTSLQNKWDSLSAYSCNFIVDSLTLTGREAELKMKVEETGVTPDRQVITTQMEETRIIEKRDGEIRVFFMEVDLDTAQKAVSRLKKDLLI